MNTRYEVGQKVGIIPAYSRDISTWAIGTVTKVTGSGYSVDVKGKIVRFTNRGREHGGGSSWYVMSLTTEENAIHHNTSVLGRKQRQSVIGDLRNLTDSLHPGREFSEEDKQKLRNILDRM